jgi:probable RNA-binding protein EIF1AD
MSHARKHVTREVLDSYPTPEPHQQIVRVTEMRGGNIIEVEYPDRTRILCLLPAKFKKTVWVKRGNYVIIEPFTEILNNYHTAKLKGRIVHILYPYQIKYLKQKNLWPQAFLKIWPKKEEKEAKQDEDEEDDKEDEDEDEDEADDKDEEDEEEEEEKQDKKEEEEEEEDPYLINTNHQTIDDSESEEEGWEY